MTPLQKATLSFLSVLACSLTVLVVWLWHERWNQPLGPALQIPPFTPLGLPATWTPDPNLTGTPLSIPQSDPAGGTSSTQAVSRDLTQACGAPPVMNILVIGSDSRGETYNYGLADVIRIVRVDFAHPKVTVLEIPRDLWVEIPDVADNLSGQDHEKLNQAYLYGNPGFGYTDDPAQGPGLLARTLTLNFGAQPDHYAAVNMKTFVKIVNTLGGIDVYLPEPVDGRTAEDTSRRLLFTEGKHHLDGKRALTLARIRIQGGFARAENQNRVLCALRDKLASPEVVTKIPKLIKSFQGAVQTDLSPAQLGQLACMGAQIGPGDIRFASFPEEHFTQTRIYDPVFKKRVSVWEVDFDVLREYVRQFHEGSWPPLSGTPENKESLPFCP